MRDGATYRAARRLAAREGRPIMPPKPKHRFDPDVVKLRPVPFVPWLVKTARATPADGAPRDAKAESCGSAAGRKAIGSR